MEMRNRVVYDLMYTTDLPANYKFRAVCPIGIIALRVGAVRMCRTRLRPHPHRQRYRNHYR